MIFAEFSGKKKAGKEVAVLPVYDVSFFHGAEVGIGVFVAQAKFQVRFFIQFHIKSGIGSSDVFFQPVLGGQAGVVYFKTAIETATTRPKEIP